MTRISLSQIPNFKQLPLSKKGKNCHCKENSKLFHLKASSRNINYKDPLAWAVYIYATLSKPIQRVFDYLRKLETCRRTKGYIFIEDETIAKRLGYKDKKTVQKYIKHLVNVGLLWRHRYYPPREASKGSKRFMCTFLNIDQFRKKQIGKYRKVGVLHKKCIQSFEQYVQYMKDQSTNFMREEMEETQAEIDANEANNELNYQREKSDRKLRAELSSCMHHALYENAASITQFSLRDKYDNTIYNNSLNFGIKDHLSYQTIDDYPLVARYQGMANNSLISPQREMELAIDQMCLTQPQFIGKKHILHQNFRKAWALKYDAGLEFKKSPLHLAAHSTIHGYEIKYGEKRIEPIQTTKPDYYYDLYPCLRFGDYSYEPEPLNKQMASKCRQLLHEVRSRFGDQLKEVGYTIGEYDIEKSDLMSVIKIKYNNPYIFSGIRDSCRLHDLDDLLQFLSDKLFKPQ